MTEQTEQTKSISGERLSDAEIYQEMQSANFQIIYYVGKLYQLHTNITDTSDIKNYCRIRDRMDTISQNSKLLADNIMYELRKVAKAEAMKRSKLGKI